MEISIAILPCMLPNEAINEFIELHQKRYGIKLSKQEAQDKANSLLRLYSAVYESPLKSSTDKS